MIGITFLILSSRLGWAGVWGHGAVVFPPPRNNIDHGEAPWNAEVPRPVPAVSDPKNGVWCPIPNPFFNNNLTGRYFLLLKFRDAVKSKQAPPGHGSSCPLTNGLLAF